jgi:hypothetical protein
VETEGRKGKERMLRQLVLRAKSPFNDPIRTNSIGIKN